MICVVQRPSSAFSNPDMAAEVQRLEWHAARRRGGPHSAPGGGVKSRGTRNLPGSSALVPHGSLGVGLTALASSRSAPVSASSRQRGPHLRERPQSSPLLMRYGVNRGSSGHGGAAETSAKQVVNTRQGKGITMAKSTRQQGVRYAGKPAVTASSRMLNRPSFLVFATWPCFMRE